MLHGALPQRRVCGFLEKITKFIISKQEEGSIMFQIQPGHSAAGSNPED